MNIYFGFAVADSMFPEETCQVVRTPLSLEDFRETLQRGIIPCVNPSHSPTIEAMKKRFSIDIEVPEKPPTVLLKKGDMLIVMSVRGLPRLTNRHEYTPEEINEATFKFSRYEIS